MLRQAVPGSQLPVHSLLLFCSACARVGATRRMGRPIAYPRRSHYAGSSPISTGHRTVSAVRTDPSCKRDGSPVASRELREPLERTSIRSQAAVPSSSLSTSTGTGSSFRAVRRSLMIPSHNTSAMGSGQTETGVKQSLRRSRALARRFVVCVWVVRILRPAPRNGHAHPGEFRRVGDLLRRWQTKTHPPGIPCDPSFHRGIVTRIFHLAQTVVFPIRGLSGKLLNPAFRVDQNGGDNLAEIVQQGTKKSRM